MTYVPRWEQFPGPATGTPPTMVILGDSITARNFMSSPVVPWACGYWTMANIMLGHRFTLLKNAGVGAETTAQILARVAADVVAYHPGWCVVEAGLNDVTAGVAETTIETNLTAIYDALIAAGIRPIATTVTSSAAWDPAQITKQKAVNTWMRAYCAAHPRVYLCDWVTNFTDPADDFPYAAYVIDNAHPSADGAICLGTTLAALLAPLVPDLGICHVATTAANLLLYSRGLFIDPTGGLAAGWTVVPPDGGSVVTTQVVRSDGEGFWQQLAITNAAHNDCRLTTYGRPIDSGLAEGDIIRCGIEFEIDAGATLSGRSELYVQFAGEGSYNGDGMSSYADSPLMTTVLASGVWLTPEMTVPVGATSVAPNVYTKLNGTIRLGRCFLVKAP